MKLENYSFSFEEIESLKNYRDHQQDRRLMRRFLALIMVAEKLPLT